MKNKKELETSYDMRVVVLMVVMLFVFLLGLSFIVHNAYGAENGQAVYEQTCAACHAGGVAGAPKTGDKSAWSDRLAKGNSILYEHAIKGFQGKAGMMPAKGGNTGLSDAAVKAAVDYMLGKVK